MIHLAEQGRRLVITLAAGTEDAESFVVPPADAEAGAALLSGFVGITAGLFGDDVQAEADVIKLALGLPTPVEPGAGPRALARYEARMVEFRECYDHVNEMRSAEMFQIVQCAFFWQTNGGSLEAAQQFVDDGAGPDALGKALELVAARLGLSDLTETLGSLGTTSTSTASPTPTPGEPSTPGGSESGSRTPGVPPHVKQPTDRLPAR